MPHLRRFTRRRPLANATNAINATGDGLVVGAPGKLFSPPGRVYVYPSNGAGLTSTGLLTFAGNDVSFNCFDFGSDVANAGNDLAVSIHVYGADIGVLGSSIRRRYDLPVRDSV